MSGDPRTDREGELPPIVLPERHNYVGVFLTFRCALGCSYCINRFGGLNHAGEELSGEVWARALNRIVSRPDLPLTLQGGEPTLHRDFFAIVRGIRPGLNLDLLTNLEGDVGRFMAEIPPGRMRREAPYASIRVSFHPERMRIEPLAEKVLTLQDAGYSVGIWGVLHPLWEGEVLRAKDLCLARGIDFRTKEFLGVHAGVLHGRYAYPGACGGKAVGGRVMCRTDELLVGPGGGVFRCHSDLYTGQPPVGSLLDPGFALDPGFRPCDRFGLCNPCDVKVKTDRFQVDGHTSAQIRFD